jgi:predicted RNase H-like nuclease
VFGDLTSGYIVVPDRAAFGKGAAGVSNGHDDEHETER